MSTEKYLPSPHKIPNSLGLSLSGGGFRQYRAGRTLRGPRAFPRINEIRAVIDRAYSLGGEWGRRNSDTLLPKGAGILRMMKYAGCFLAILFLLSAPAFAEVLDKVTTIDGIPVQYKIVLPSHY